MTMSQTIEEAIHATITSLKFQKPAKYPTLTVKMEYTIPPAERADGDLVLAGGIIEAAKDSRRTELGNGEDYDHDERHEPPREGLYPPREEYLNATCNQSLWCENASVTARDTIRSRRQGQAGGNSPQAQGLCF